MTHGVISNAQGTLAIWEMTDKIDMRRKPWSIIILAALHVMAPLSNMLFSAYLSHQPVSVYLKSFPSTLDLVTFFSLFPVAGYAIFAMKIWSYPVFASILAWSFHLNYSTYLEYPTHFTLPMLVVAYVINLGVVSYFLIPAVRAGYFNPRLRWWESKPRYEVQWDVEAETLQGHTLGRISNISEGGAFVVLKQPVTAGDLIKLYFSFHHLELEVLGKVAHLSTKGAGIQFDFPTRKSKKHLQNLVQVLHRLDFPCQRVSNSWLDDFRFWASRLVKTGRGWVPELPGSGGTGGGNSNVVPLRSKDSSDQETKAA